MYITEIFSRTMSSADFQDVCYVKTYEESTSIKCFLLKKKSGSTKKGFDCVSVPYNLIG